MLLAVWSCRRAYRVKSIIDRLSIHVMSFDEIANNWSSINRFVCFGISSSRPPPSASPKKEQRATKLAPACQRERSKNNTGSPIVDSTRTRDKVTHHGDIYLAQRPAKVAPRVSLRTARVVSCLSSLGGATVCTRRPNYWYPRGKELLSILILVLAAITVPRSILFAFCSLPLVRLRNPSNSPPFESRHPQITHTCR